MQCWPCFAPIALRLIAYVHQQPLREGVAQIATAGSEFVSLALAVNIEFATTDLMARWYEY